MNTEHAYELQPGDIVGELGLVLDCWSFSFTTMLFVIDEHGTKHVYDYPGDTLFDLD